MRKRIVIALGGNALGSTPYEQLALVTETAKPIVDLIAQGNEVIIAHGNGPQVGMINLGMATAAEAGAIKSDMPFPECGAMSQGYIGYHLQNAIGNELASRGMNKDVATVVTQVLVDEADPAFQHPTKPVGAFYDKETADRIAAEKGYTMVEDAGRGYRQVVPSPKPIDVIEKNTVKALVDNGTVVITVGGGGIPVVRKDGKLYGTPAVIDKDFAGLATPDDAVNLAFKLPGQVLDVPVAQGESVKKGALLAELDPRDIELQVSADRSAFEEARSQMQRMQRLLEHEAVSRQEFESAQTRYAQVKSAYENSLGLLKETKLRAPFASVVERKFVDNYERVQAGQSIVRVVNPVTTKVQFTMPESGLSLLSSPSTRFEVEFDNYRGVRFPAVLKDYAKTSSDASGFPVSLRLTDVDTGRYSISPGMSCMVTMQSADPVTDAVSLPVSAVYAPAEGGTYVWVVTGGDRVERRAVTLGELYGRDRVVVDSGVEPGERVVTAGVYQLRQGERVRILN